MSLIFCTKHYCSKNLISYQETKYAIKKLIAKGFSYEEAKQEMPMCQDCAKRAQSKTSDVF